MPVEAAAAYHFRGASADGVLKLTPAQAEFSADIVSTTAPITGGRIDKTTFAIHLSKGALGSLAVVEREADAAKRSWRVTGGENAVATAVALPLTSWANPFGLVLGRMDTGGQLAGSGLADSLCSPRDLGCRAGNDCNAHIASNR